MRIRRHLRRRRWTLVAIAVLLLVGFVVYVRRPTADLRTGSLEVSTGRVDIASRVPRSYRIVYRSESRAGDDVVVNTDEVVVDRPFDARSQTRAATAGSKTRAKTVNAFGRLATDRTVLAVGPSPASLDRRADVFFPAAVEDGFAAARELRRIANRTCRIFRIAGSSATPSLEKVSDADDDYSEVCVDEAGLILEELGVVDGKLLTRRIATRVDEDPKVDDGIFDLGAPTLGVRQGGGSVRRMADDSRPPGNPFWEPEDAPGGFRHRGRYAVVPPQSGFDDPTQRSQLIAFTSDVWVDGRDAIVVEQGATLGGSEPFEEDLSSEFVDVGDIGEGELVYGYITTEVRFLLGGGRFVRVFGTVEPKRLLAMARSLEEKEGGTLVFADEGPSTPD
jgi:hypothetical protein